MRRRLTTALIIGLAPLAAFAAPPVLHFSDLTWGPKAGWEGSTTKGAAVTIWGENFGSSRATSYVTVNGAQLTADTDYAEWGATAGNARGLQRITFWLNSACADGSGTISVNVGGAVSNPLPFTVAPGAIYFVSVSDGSNANNGLYSSARGGGNGPFRDLYKFGFQNNPSGDGQYIAYVRGGTYTAQDPAGDSTIISYRGPSGGATKQKALIAYPAESPVINASGLTRGVIWNADYSPYGRNSYLTYSKLTVVNGTDAFYIYGDYNRVIGNHFQNMLDMVWSGVVFVANSQHTEIDGNFFDHCGSTSQGSYKHNVYIQSNTLSQIVPSLYSYVGWNEFSNPEAGTDNRGGTVFVRTDSTVQSTAVVRYVYIHDNSFHGGNQNFIEIGDGPPQSDVWIYNNTFMGGPSVNSALSIRWTTSNANLFNNSIYMAGSPNVAIVDVVGLSPGSNLTSANNIFYASSGQPFFNVESGSTMTSTRDLFYGANGSVSPPSGPGLTVSGPVLGNPQFVNPAAGDFHIQSSSPAVDGGTNTVSSVFTTDFEGVKRPQGSQYDVGAFEFGGSTSVTPVSIAVSPATASLSQGQTLQFTATVGGTSNPAATWSLSPAVGTISASGLYTAPGSITTQQTVQVRATSAADNTKAAAATITLTPPAAVVTIAVSPVTASLSQGQTRQFTATVGGTGNTAATWSLSPAVGTISASGLYTAPGSVSTQQTVQVRATSAADSTKAAAATITLNPPAAVVTIGVSPVTASLSQGQAMQFTATVGGTSNTAATWSLSPAVGTISASGLYTAPGSITTQQTVQVRAASAADSTKSAVASITLIPPAAPVPASKYSVSFSQISATQLQVSWSAPAGHSSYDAVILAGDSSVGWWYAWSGRTNTATSGTFVVSVPTQPGIWQFKYLSAAGNNVVAVSAVLPIGVAQFNVTASPTGTTVGGNLYASYTAPSDRPKTWADQVCLYAVAATNNAPLACQYTMGATSGSFTVRAPAAGSYEFRYVASYLEQARSATITVR